jgi:glycosyltransferase involved in cell wall biosynthesis
MDHAAASVAMKQAPEPGYLLHVGGDPWYKNRGQVLKTFIDIRKTTSRTPALVLVGPPLAPAQVQALRRAGLADEVTVFTDISHESLCALYSMAGALLFPSVAEGFGWPILEAQACGCPVVTTNAEPMRETSGGAAIFADEGGWEAAVTRVLEMNGAERAALVTAGMENARKYSVKRMAREYIEFYRRHAD